MSVYMDKSWKTSIPYVIHAGVKDRTWLETWITHFNARVSKKLYVPQDSTNAPADKGQNYVEFFEVESGHSPIGKQGGMQRVLFHKTTAAGPVQYTILHEMGHCAGLGHENYNPTWKFKDRLEGIHVTNYENEKGKYLIFQNGPCDYDSIMMYTLGAFGITKAGLKDHFYPPPNQPTRLPDEKTGAWLIREGKEKVELAKVVKQQQLEFNQNYGRYFTKPGDLSDTDVALIQHLYPSVT